MNLNIFKSTSQEKLVETKPYPKEVIEIHNEFNNAADVLLQEAREVLEKSSTFNVEKAKRLASFGFKSAKNVTEGLNIKEKIEFTQAQIESLNYYKKVYPNNKFITEKQVEAICLKWNLIMGEPDCFTGFIPEKNLQDIETFCNKYNVMDKQIYLTKNNNILDMTGTVIKPNEYVSTYFHFYNIDSIETTGKQGPISSSQNRSLNYAFQSDDGINFYGSGIINGVKYDERFNIKNKINPLSICAPLKDMNVEGRKFKNKYSLEILKHKVEVPDPVVLYQVKDGYIIVTAWGDESEDPIIKN
jgi:hypothetical protein